MINDLIIVSFYCFKKYESKHYFVCILQLTTQISAPLLGATLAFRCTSLRHCATAVVVNVRMSQKRQCSIPGTELNDLFNIVKVSH